MQQKSLFKNTVYKSILVLFNIVVPIIIGPYILRVLDVNLYGTYNRVYSEFQVFIMFASFGIYTFGIREISKVRDNPQKVSKLFSNLFLMSLITNLTVLAIYVLYSVLTSDGITTILYLLMTIQIIGNIFYIEFVNEALENYKFITIKTAIIKLFYLLSLLFLVKEPDDIIIYSLIICLTVFLNNIVSFIYAKRKIKFDFSDIEFKKYIKSMFIILIIENADMLYGQLDRIMLGKFVDDVSVSIYHISFYLIGTLAAIPYTIINVSIPRLSYVLKNESKENYNKLLQKSFSSLLFVILPCCMGVFVVAKEVLFIYAGENYVNTYNVLMIACIVRIFLTIQSVFTNLVLYPNNKDKIILKYCLSFGIVNLFLNSLLILFKIFNPATAMISTGLCTLLLFLSEKLFSKHNLNIDLKIFSKDNIIYFILSLLFIPISYSIRLFNLPFIYNLSLIIISCSLTYGLILLIFKDANLLLIINKFKNKIKRGV